MNTHLHHSDFDRDAGKGQKFNYIHCLCTNEDKRFLEEQFHAEIGEGNIINKSIYDNHS